MSKYELVIVSGPLEGQRVRLDNQQTLLLGRTPRGLNLPDPQVSPKHAEISWSGDRFWIVDLDSATGTVVNGRRVGREPLALHPGMRIEIGESILVMKIRQTLPNWLLWVIAIFLVTIGPLTLYTAYKTLSTFSKRDPALSFASQEMVLRTPCGEVSELRIDSCFMQETGQNQTLYWKKLRDLDGDGFDELWLEHPDGERIYTFGDQCDENGQPNWLLMAKLPKECIAQDATGLSELQCPGRTTYRYVSGKPQEESEVSCSEWSPKGRYRVISQSGVTAWMPNSATKEQKGGGPYPYQFTFFKPDTLAGFLEARGIDEPIHFMVCEDFLPGLAPQVMTQSGEIKPLQWGCIREISLGGTMRDRWFGSDLPKAVAFTSVGRQALVDQTAVFLSGTPDAGFMTASQEDLWTAIQQPPESRSSVLLTFHAPDQGMFWGGATEQDSIDVKGRLGRLKLADPLPALGKTWNGGEKFATLEAPCGCSVLSISTEETVVGSSLLNSTPFLKIEEVRDDCAGISQSAGGPPWTVPYETGRYRFSHNNIDVEVDLRMTSGDQIAQVVSVGISYRTPYTCGDNEVQDFPVQSNMFDEPEVP